MSAYRYVVFPQGRQPTVDEVRQLQQFAGALANRFAYGTSRRDGRLTIAFDQGAFDHVLSNDAGFASLIRRWEVRGCDFVDHLPFVKDGDALRPLPTPPLHGSDGCAPLPALSNPESLTARQLAANEAVARSLLGVARTLQRYAFIERLGAAAPYLMMLAAILTTIAVGAFIHGRLSHAPRERRLDVIERVAQPGIEQPSEQSAPPVSMMQRDKGASTRPPQ